MAFVIYSSKCGGGLLVDVPAGNTGNNSPVKLYGDFHGGDNQFWSLEIADNSKTKGTVSIDTLSNVPNNYHIISQIDSNICLGVNVSQETTDLHDIEVVLCNKQDEDFLNIWSIKEKGRYVMISLVNYPEMAVTNYMDERLVLSDIGYEIGFSWSTLICWNIRASQLWYLDKEPTFSESKPASSCHLKYGPNLPLSKSDYERVMKKHGWCLTNTVRVEEVADCTYFCVIGWSPGGYCGIQQVDSGKRVVIYSMWHDSDIRGSRVTLEDAGDHVAISTFGGEGEGMKSMKVVHWKVGEDITLNVSARYVDKESGGAGGWYCSCWYRRSSEDVKHLMATFFRPGERSPLDNGGFGAFIEDWDRSSDACGYLARRAASFSNPSITYGGNCRSLRGGLCDNMYDTSTTTTTTTTTSSSSSCIRNVTIDNPHFDKVTTGADKYASHLANAKVLKGTPTYFMETGGSPKYIH